MKALRKANLSGEEEGFTLVEMMVTIVIMLAVFFALHAIFDMSFRVFSFSNNKVEAVENARVGMERMIREIRAAYPYAKPCNPPDERLFAVMGETQVAFGNDLDGDRKVDLPVSEGGCDDPEPEDEEITYFLNDKKLMRQKGDESAQPVAENVADLRIEYLKRSGDGLVAATAESEVEVVRVKLEVRVGRGAGRGTQTLAAETELRNR